MEIETADIKKEVSKENIEKKKYLSQLLGIKLKTEELNLFQDMNEINTFVNNIKFSDKKKIEIKDEISNEIKSLQNEESLQKLLEEQSKKFSDVMKLNGKTTIYNTAEKDDLSQTMHAFYFCDKSKQILSDKQAAEYKAIHFDTGYEFPLVGAFGMNEEDNISSNSNIKIHNNIKDNIDNDRKLKKKRKLSNNFSNKSKQCKRKKPDKINQSEDYNNSKNIEKDEDKDYCIQKCKYGRKSENLPMIECDKCKKWYHFKCLNFSYEQSQKCCKGKIWFCPFCSKMDIEDKKYLNK